MPIFEYQCQTCGYIFERVRVVRRDDDLPQCPICHESSTRQLISRFSSPSTNGLNMACGPGAVP